MRERRPPSRGCRSHADPTSAICQAAAAAAAVVQRETDAVTTRVLDQGGGCLLHAACSFRMQRHPSEPRGGLAGRAVPSARPSGGSPGIGRRRAWAPAHAPGPAPAGRAGCTASAAAARRQSRQHSTPARRRGASAARGRNTHGEGGVVRSALFHRPRPPSPLPSPPLPPPPPKKQLPGTHIYSGLKVILHAGQQDARAASDQVPEAGAVDAAGGFQVGFQGLQALRLHHQGLRAAAAPPRGRATRRRKE